MPSSRPESPPAARANPWPRVPAMPALGAALLSAGACVVLWLEGGPGAAARVPAALWLLLALAGPIALGAFVLWQARRERRWALALQRQRWARRQALLQLLDLLPSAVALCGVHDSRIAPNLAMAQWLALDRGKAAEPGAVPPAEAPTFDWHQALAAEDRPAWETARAAALASGVPQWLRCTLDVRGTARAVVAQLATFHGEEGVELAVGLSPLEGEAGIARDTILQLHELLALSEAEKWHFGQAVHDELGQRLSGMAYFARALQRKLQNTQHAGADDAGWLTDLANESMGVARGLARGLLPVGSDDPGALGAALTELCDKAGKTFGIRCTLSVEPGFEAGGAAKASHLYHAVQELVTNAVKHGQAQVVEVKLWRSPGQQRVSVCDNGRGLGPGLARLGMGLSGVRSRSAYLGAQFSLANDEHGGVRAQIDWPVPPGPAADHPDPTGPRADTQA